MPLLLTTISVVNCPHGGTAILSSVNWEATIDRNPILLIVDVHPIVGCPFNVLGAPSPCVLVRWQNGTVQARHRLGPFVFLASIGLCFNAASVPQGPAVLSNPSICDAL